MKRLKPILFILIAFWSSLLHAQNSDTVGYTYSISEPIKPVMARKNYYFGWGNSAVICRNLGASIGIQALSGEQMNPGSYILANDFGKYFAIEQFLQEKDTVYLFYSIWDPEQYKEQLFVRTMLISSAQFIGEGRKLLEVSGKVRGGNGNKFHIGLSGDRTLYYVKYRKTIDTRVTNFEEFGAAIFDDQLQLLVQEEMTMPLERDQMKVMDYNVSSDGSISILAKIDSIAFLASWIDNEFVTVDFVDSLKEKVIMYKYVWMDGAEGVPMFAVCGMKNEFIEGLYCFEMGDNHRLQTINRYVLTMHITNSNEFKMFMEADGSIDVINSRYYDVQVDNKHYRTSNYVYAHVDRYSRETIDVYMPGHAKCTRRGFTTRGMIIGTEKLFWFRTATNHQPGDMNRDYLLITEATRGSNKYREWKIFDPYAIHNVKIKEMDLKNVFALSDTEFVIPVYDIHRMERFVKVTLQDTETMKKTSEE